MHRMPLRVAGPLTLVLLGALGCKAEAFGGEDIVIDPATVEIEGLRLPGSLLTVSWPGAPRPHETATLWIDDTLALPVVWSTGPSEGFSARLPIDLAGGGHAIALEPQHAGRTALGVLVTGGFTETRYAEGTILGTSQPLPQLPGIVGFSYGGTVCDYVVTLLDARAARIWDVPGSEVCNNFGLGTSHQPGSFTVALQNDKQNWHRAGLEAGAMWVDSTRLWGSGGIVHELAPGIYLDASKHWTNLWGPAVTDGGISLSYDLKNPQHIAFSDDGHWAVADHVRSVEGILIVDRVAGTHHWAAGWSSVRTDVLSDGTIVGFGLTTPEATPTGSRYRMGLIDPATGVTTISVAVDTMPTFWDFWTEGRVYALGSLDLIVLMRPMGERWELSFRDPESLEEVGQALSPATSGGCVGSSEPWLIEDPSLHRMYLTSDYCARIPVITFVLPE